ncbi:MAG: type II toxin-antitoxin system RelE/ParE family toxin [Armatimonadetes bacterium]|nr:type II toxin-antitoxin system RelE/ParE family toxin [Armatimonadota bacterium]
MKQPFINPEALGDLDVIWDYVAQDSITRANRLIDEIYEAIYQLVDRPEIGHLREDVADRSLRFWRVHSYLIVYRPDTKPLEIARILSGYRNVGALL